MITLTKNEILAELQKFGITSQSEIRACLKEYKKYFLVIYPKKVTRQ